jgi:hypothetical protein
MTSDLARDLRQYSWMGRAVIVETRRGTPAEEQTKSTLETLLDAYVLAPYTFTTRVRIDENAIAHSHPVLTLSTRFMVRTLDGMLADYLHEQLHWYVAGRRRQSRRANAEWRAMFGKVPRRSGGGAKTRRSTLLHLTVNWLELDALKRVIGDDRAAEVLQAKANGKIYPWVYRQVRDSNGRLADVLKRVGLADPAAG